MASVNLDALVKHALSHAPGQVERVGVSAGAPADAAQTMAFLTMGTGIGSGLILNGRLHRGAFGAGDEVGHSRSCRTDVCVTVASKVVLTPTPPGRP